MSVRYPNVSNIWERERCVPLCVLNTKLGIWFVVRSQDSALRVFCVLYDVCTFLLSVQVSFFEESGFHLNEHSHTHTHVLLPEYASV